MTDFDALRIALMDTYNLQVTNHIGYIVAIVIAVATVYLNKDTMTYLNKNKWLSYLVLGSSIGMVLYFAFRIVYWAWMGSMVLTVTEQQALSVNSSTQIFGIQLYLLDQFTKPHNSLVYGMSSFFYSLNQTFFGVSSILLVCISSFVVAVGSFCRPKFKAGIERIKKHM